MKLECYDCGSIFDKTAEVSKMEYAHEPVFGEMRTKTYEQIFCPDCGSYNVGEFDDTGYVSSVARFLSDNGVCVEDYTVGVNDLEFIIFVRNKEDADLAENMLYDVFYADEVAISKNQEGIYGVLFTKRF